MDNLTLRNTDSVQHISHNIPKPEDLSWKRYWEKNSNEAWPKKCRKSGCGEKALSGACVVVNYDEENHYIIPLCNEHMNAAKVVVDSGTVAMWVNEEGISEELADSLVENSSGELFLPAGIRVRNVPGTGGDKPRIYQSWKKFYEENGVRDWPTTCRVRNCGQPADGGAHVHVEGKYADVYIVPMCDKLHNNAQNMEWLTVKKDTIALRVYPDDSKTHNVPQLRRTFSPHKITSRPVHKRVETRSNVCCQCVIV